MQVSMANSRFRRPYLAICLLLGIFSGCSGLGDLSPSNNRQNEDAKLLRESQPATPPRELDLVTHPPFVLEAGDALLIQPVDLESTVRLPNDQVVQPDGSIDLGKYGRLFVAGRPITEIETAIQQAVRLSEKTKNNTDPGFIDVRLVSRTSKNYYVLGEVNTPGSFPVIGRETVLDAIIAAGGVTDRASLENVALSRPSRPGYPRTVMPVCYPAIVQLGDTTTNYQMRPGDRIFVPSKAFCEGWLGKKKKPGGEAHGNAPHASHAPDEVSPNNDDNPKRDPNSRPDPSDFEPIEESPRSGPPCHPQPVPPHREPPQRDPSNRPRAESHPAIRRIPVMRSPHAPPRAWANRRGENYRR